MPARVEFRLGSIFDEPCDLLVIPSSAGGTVTPEIQRKIRDQGLPFPGAMTWGDLSLFEVNHPGFGAVAYAATVAGQASALLVVEEIARQVGLLAKVRGFQIIAAPLLGAGSGDLAPDVAAGALMRGFMSTAPDGTLLVISIRDRERLKALAQKFPHAVGNHVRTPTSLRALTEAEVHPRTEEPPLTVHRYSVEPGEIESILLRHPAVTAAVVHVREDAPAERRLVAYVVPAAGTASHGSRLAAEIHDALEEHFPEYLLPSAIVPLDALPLMPNGKVDRAALPAPTRSGTEPRTYVERVLATIWKEVLGQWPVYLEDDFFELGGDSLHAIRVVARVHQRLSVTFSVEMLLKARTLAGLATWIERAQLEAKTGVLAVQADASILRSTQWELTDHVSTDSPLSTSSPDPVAKSSPRKGVFISYSHADAEWLERLQKHLKPLQRDGVEVWDDTRLKAGEQWRDEIRDALAAAKVAILLISADFLASDFIVTNELPPLLKAAEEDGATIIPVIVSPCRFTRMASLSRFQAVNDPAKPLVQMRRAGRETVLDQVARAVEDALSR